MNLLTNDLTVPPPVNFPVVSGGFALLATTGALAAGLGGPAGAAAGGAAVGALTVGGVVTGLVPLVAAGALGVLGEKYLIIFVLNNIILCLLSVVRSVHSHVCRPPLLHHTWWPVLSPGSGPEPGSSRLSSLLLGLTPTYWSTFTQSGTFPTIHRLVVALGMFDGQLWINIVCCCVWMFVACGQECVLHEIISRVTDSQESRLIFSSQTKYKPN